MAQVPAGDVQVPLSSGRAWNALLPLPLQVAELLVCWWFYVSRDVPDGLHSCLPLIFIHACFAFISG